MMINDELTEFIIINQYLWLAWRLHSIFSYSIRDEQVIATNFKENTDLLNKIQCCYD